LVHPALEVTVQSQVSLSTLDNIAMCLWQEPQHRENQVRVRKIFVGGLKETTDESILSDYFSQFGHVDHVDLIEDRATKRLRGFAYVTFNDYDPVDKAVCTCLYV